MPTDDLLFQGQKAECDAASVDSRLPAVAAFTPTFLFSRLQEVELDRRLATKEGDQHLDLTLLLIDLVDLAAEIGEWPVDDADRVAELEGHLDLRRFGGHALHDLLDFALGERNRFVVDIDETGDARRVSQGVPGLVVHFHANEHVTGKDFALHRVALAAPDFDLFLGRHDDFEDAFMQIECFDTVLDRLLDFVLVAGIGVENVPLVLRTFLQIHLARRPVRRESLAERLATHGDYLLPPLASVTLQFRSDALEVLQRLKNLEEDIVDAAEKQAENDRKSNNHDGQIARRLLVRPGDLGHFGPRVAQRPLKARPCVA